MSDTEQDVLRVLVAGDLSKLSDVQQVWYYRHECERMGLDPLARPLEWITLSGRLTLYAKRVAADMLAAKHRISVVLVTEPEERTICGVKILFARARATMPDGRAVEDVGTTAATGDVVNAVMRCATKAARRATLRLCGWGGLDESELETIPGARRPDAPAAPILDAPAEEHAALAELRDRLAQDGVVPSLDALAQVYDETVGSLGPDDGATKLAGLRACYAHLEETLQVRGARVRLKGAIDALERARAQARRDAAELPPIDQAEADMGRARSADELAAIAREVATLRLRKGSPGQVRLRAAYQAAQARLAGRGADADPERDAIVSEVAS